MSNSRRVISFNEAAGLILITLKLIGEIDWAWGWVFVPLYYELIDHVYVLCKAEGK